MDEQRIQLQRRGLKGEELEAELDKWAVSQEAFFAAIGKKYKSKDDDPLPVYDPSRDPSANPNLQYLRPPVDDQQSGQYVIPGTRGLDGTYVNREGRTIDEIRSDPRDSDKRLAILYGLYERYPGLRSTLEPYIQGAPKEAIYDQPIFEDQRRAILYKMYDEYPELRRVLQIEIDKFQKEDMLAQLQKDDAAYQQVNQYLESQYGPYWDETRGEWADSADSKKERQNLGLPEWVEYPSKPGMLNSYYQWLREGNPPDMQAFLDWYYRIYGY